MVCTSPKLPHHSQIVLIKAIDILPIIMTAIECPTPAIVDVAMRGLPTVLPILDFSTIKNELFPVIATVFSKTNSLAIKVRGLQAFVILCGGSNDPSGGDDGLDGFAPEKKKTSSSSALDKYTMQEKIVPLVKVIKTKEPAVMMAALSVLRVVGDVADADFVAMDILPILWSMSLGPLLDLKQFQSFMELIRTLSRRVEDEQTKKLQELSGSSSNGKALENEDFMAFGGVTGTTFDTNGSTEDDFEKLIRGKVGGGGGSSGGVLDSSNPMDAGWGDAPGTTRSSTPQRVKSPPAPAFSWSTPSPTTATSSAGGFGAAMKPQPSFRTVTPDLNSFQSLTPQSTQFSQPLQPVTSPKMGTGGSNPWASSSSTITPVAAAAPTANPWASSSTTSKPMMSPPSSSMASMSLNQQRPAMPSSSLSSFSLAPPPSTGTPSASAGFSLPPPPGGAQPQRNMSTSSFGGGSSSASAFGQPPPALSSFGGAAANSASTSSMGSMMGVTGMAAMRPMNNSMSSMSSMSNNNKMGMGSMMGGSNSMGMGMGMAMNQQQKPAQPQPQQQHQQQGSGLDKYESLL